MSESKFNGSQTRTFNYFQNIPKFNECHKTHTWLRLLWHFSAWLAHFFPKNKCIIYNFRSLRLHFCKWPPRWHPQTFSSSAPHDCKSVRVYFINVKKKSSCTLCLNLAIDLNGFKNISLILLNVHVLYKVALTHKKELSITQRLYNQINWNFFCNQK